MSDNECLPKGRPTKVAPEWYPPCKALMDGVLALTLLVLTGPVILGIALLVRATSRGPGLYSQVRVGRAGRRFKIYKIRTMTHDCERLSGPRWSTPGDPRVTPLGRWLRKTHLDELPQLWNVLRGEMSLVGPRPERPEFVAQLERAVPGYRDRLEVRPGVTGLAQVQLPPDEDLAGVRRKVSCDATYVARMGLWLDLKILVATVLKVAGVPSEARRRALRLPGAPSLPPLEAAAAAPAVAAAIGLEEPPARLQTA